MAGVIRLTLAEAIVVVVVVLLFGGEWAAALNGGAIDEDCKVDGD
jgi:hypothetical protein